MARIRTIKPSFWGSADVAKLTRDARLTFIGIWSAMADDDGRFLASLNAINGAVYPNDDLPVSRVARWIAELVEVGVIYLYYVDGVRYGVIPTFNAHQVINRPTPSVLPEPDIECAPRIA